MKDGKGSCDCKRSLAGMEGPDGANIDAWIQTVVSQVSRSTSKVW